MRKRSRAARRTTSRRPIVALAGAVATTLLLTAGLAGSALAAPTEVTVRIEGATQTIFEGPLLTDGHAVRAASDTASRRCDGTNNGQHPTAGPTPTAAADDALRLAGLDFDGRWYPGYDDYFVTRLGPDPENAGEFWHWGVLVDGAFTAVGGCQARLTAGQEALWAFNAFSDRRFLRLTATGTDGIARGDVAVVEVGVPVELRVASSAGGMDGVGQDTRAEAGIAVAPVATDPVTLFQTALPDGVETGGDGRAWRTFDSPGWHRVKAVREGATGPDGYVRSNRVDICAIDPPSVVACPPPPVDVAVRPPGTDPGPGGPRPPTDQPPTDPGDRATGGERPRLSKPWLLTGLAPRGQFGLRWTVLEAGAGVRSWSVASRALGKPRCRWARRASGTGARLMARFRLPAGRTHALRLTVVDRRGNRAVTGAGRALAPLDDRSRRLRYAGRWRSARDAGAWRRTVRRGRTGATVRVRLPAGRPTFLLRATRRAARVAVRVGGRSEVFALAPGRADAERTLTARRRPRAGIVELRVLAGEARLDGVAVAP